jgi:hypothetical protein
MQQIILCVNNVQIMTCYYYIAYKNIMIEKLYFFPTLA